MLLLNFNCLYYRKSIELTVTDNLKTIGMIDTFKTNQFIKKELYDKGNYHPDLEWHTHILVILTI